MGEMSVIAGGTLVNVEKVSALDSIEGGQRWSKSNLVDGVLALILWENDWL